jgi:uncharacterized repeat protein (TIGR03837 family)
LRWDIFCHVIDNYGDIGVCWRLARGLAERSQSVRLFVDDPGVLSWMAPEGCAGVTVQRGYPAGSAYEPGDVVIAAFGCTLDPGLIAAIAAAPARGGRAVPWINLEYLSAEPYAARSHGLVSPVHGGAAAGLHKWFFFPGFTADTGGLLREPDLMARRQAFDRGRWLAGQGIAWAGETVISLFCYEPALLERWLAALAQGAPALLLVTHGRAAAAVRRAQAALPAGWNARGRLGIRFLPALSQREFDHLLWSADCNFVRGEDSLVRALWAGAALVWQAYPQDDEAHHAKIDAFLDWLPAPASLRRFTRFWNGIDPVAAADASLALDISAWSGAVGKARERLLAQEDLVSRLLRFVAKNR